MPSGPQELPNGLSIWAVDGGTIASPKCSLMKEMEPKPQVHGKEWLVWDKGPRKPRGAARHSTAGAVARHLLPGQQPRMSLSQECSKASPTPRGTREVPALVQDRQGKASCNCCSCQQQGPGLHSASQVTACMTNTIPSLLPAQGAQSISQLPPWAAGSSLLPPAIQAATRAGGLRALSRKRASNQGTELQMLCLQRPGPMFWPTGQDFQPVQAW